MRVIDVSSGCCIDSAVMEAVQALEAGELVVLPTDTIYGLAARADSEEAVLRIYEAKRRPADRPLPVLLADPGDVHDVAEEVSEVAQELIDRFWPGPLTIVLPKSDAVPDWVVAGRDSVGLRVPDDAVARAVLRACDFLVAVTSANISDEPTLTGGEECARSLAIEPAVVLEGGPRRQKPSTVVEIRDKRVRLLRAGPIEPRQIWMALLEAGLGFEIE